MSLPCWARQVGGRRIIVATPLLPKERPFTSSLVSRRARYERPRRGRSLGKGLALVGIIGASSLAVGSSPLLDDTKVGTGLAHSSEAATRTWRVLATLTANIDDYRKTLKLESSNPKEYAAALSACHQRCANRTLKTMEANGSIYVKLGQHLTSLNYLLPPEWTTTFVPLQDHCPVSSYQSIRALFLKDTGHPLSHYFSSFDELPIGAASLAQVHRAKLRETGEEVAVKVQHPVLDEWVPLDLKLTKLTFATMKWAFPGYDVTWLSDEMELSLPQELNFVMEKANTDRIRTYFRDFRKAPLVVPNAIWATRRILVMQFIRGHRLDDIAFLDSHRISRDEVSVSLAHIFNTMIFGHNAPLHCDPHGGNLAIRPRPGRSPNFDIVLYDHGLYRDIPEELRRSYAKLWLAVIDADEVRMRRYAKEVANVSDEDFPLFASAITGRDYRVVTKSVATPRTATEREEISDALTDGMLQQLVHLLGKVPRVMLMILKTNDLTRSLDEGLHTTQGPARVFLILARYCSRTVYEETRDGLMAMGSILWPGLFVRRLGAWLAFERVELKLTCFEWWIGVRSAFGLAPMST